MASPLVAWMHRHGVPRPAGRRTAHARRSSPSASGLFVIVISGITSESSVDQRRALGRQGHPHRLARGLRARPGHRLRREERGERLGKRRGLRLCSTASARDQRPFRARALPRLHRPQPVLPAQRRTEDPGLGGAPSRRSAAGRQGHHPAHPRGASRLLPRHHDRRGFNAVVVSVGALMLGVPLAGTIAVVTFLGGYIPYVGPGPRARSRCCSPSAGQAPTRPAAWSCPAARQQRPAAARSAVCDGRRPRDPPARGARRHDRRRRAVRRDGADPRRPAVFRRGPDLRRSGPLAGRGGPGGRIKPDAEKERADDDP